MKAALGFGIASVVAGLGSFAFRDSGTPWPHPSFLASMWAGFLLAPALATVSIALVATTLRPRRKWAHMLIAIGAITAWALMASGMVSRQLSLNEQDTTTAIWAVGDYWAYSIPLLGAISFAAGLVALLDSGRPPVVAVFGALGITVAAIILCWPLYLIGLFVTPVAAVIAPSASLVDRARLSPAPRRASR